MKALRLLVLLVAMHTAANAQGQQYLNLGQKRTNLVSQLRNLGPLAPTNWPNSLATFAGNWDVARQNYALFFVGNYGYHVVGQDPGPPVITYYDYKYQGTGNWAASDRPAVNNPDARFTGSFGIGLPFVTNGQSANFTFSLAADSYSVAGLRCESVFVVTGVSGQNLTGYTVSRGQTVNTTIPFSTSRTFDLGQNVEPPSFRIVDFYYGRFWNYPVDTKLPALQKTWRQTENAFLVSAINQITTNVCFVEEGVYRPGFALKPGLTAPALKTHVQLYFDKAYRADPITGNLPRLSATNWNGVGKINSVAAVQTGLIDFGYYFQPNECGKAILTTSPLENGFDGELPVYTFDLRVDQNRDGVINTNDLTTVASPHAFWINNDCDRAIFEEANLWDELDFQVGGTNITDIEFVRTKQRIPTLRDLEDYDRLHIRGIDTMGRLLPTGTSVTLSWKSVTSGNPGIFVFKAAETNGATQYLADPVTAASQISPSTYPPAGTEPGTSPLVMGEVIGSAEITLVSDTYQPDTDFFIYCGTSRGSGQLAVTVKRGTEVIGQASVFLSLREPQELYERWTIGDGDGTEPVTIPSLDTTGPGGVGGAAFNDNPTTPQPYIVFVHGWNMSPWEKATFGETARKRLYWQGYTNRFGVLRWPTGYGFSEQPFANPGPITHPKHYDESEFVAWKSGEGLRRHLVNLNQRYPGKVFLLAHSMGNVVAGEALALQAEKHGGGPIVSRYVASQAAVSAQSYSRLPLGSAYQMPFTYKHPKQEIIGSYVAALPGLGWITPYLNSPINWDSGTPDIYRGWLATNLASAVASINFYNPHDYALSMSAWGFNQLLKPDVTGPALYSYTKLRTGGAPRVVGGGAPSSPSFFLPSPARSGVPVLSNIRQMPGYFQSKGFWTSRFLNFEFVLSDMYETMAFAAESRTYPLGMLNDDSLLPRTVNLMQVWGNVDDEPDPNNGAFGRHKWHSGQFRSNHHRQQAYWSALLGPPGFELHDAP